MGRGSSEMSARFEGEEMGGGPVAVKSGGGARFEGKQMGGGPVLVKSGGGEGSAVREFFHQDEEYGGDGALREISATATTTCTGGTTSANSAAATLTFLEEDARHHSLQSQHHRKGGEFVLDVDAPGGRGAIRPEGSMGSIGRRGGGGIHVPRGSSGGGNRWSTPAFSHSNSERRASAVFLETRDGIAVLDDHPSHNQQHHFSSNPPHGHHRHSLSLPVNPYDTAYPSDFDSIVSMDGESFRCSNFDGIDRSDSAYDSDLYHGSGSVIADSDSVISRSSSLRSSRGTPIKVAFRYLSPHDITLIDLCNALYVLAAPREPGVGLDGMVEGSRGVGPSTGGVGIRVSRGRDCGEGFDCQVLVAMRRDADPVEPVLEDLIAFVEFFHAAGDCHHLRLEKLIVSSHYENRGFGRRLLRELHRHRRVESIEVWSLWHTEHFYRSMGYGDVQNSVTGERVVVEWGPLLLWVKPFPGNAMSSGHALSHHHHQQQYVHAQNRSGSASSGGSTLETPQTRASHQLPLNPGSAQLQHVADSGQGHTSMSYSGGCSGGGEQYGGSRGGGGLVGSVEVVTIKNACSGKGTLGVDGGREKGEMGNSLGRVGDCG
ncbi:hypothetical protein HDU67_008231 [Dinochytrium kinnereticum]|nr:hypothetical protein HDU67_008231 [Dinochytrium kinnereticum]